MTKNPTPREVEIVHPVYQPTAKELREDLRLKGTFKAAVKALVRPVRVRQVMPPKPRSHLTLERCLTAQCPQLVVAGRGKPLHQPLLAPAEAIRRFAVPQFDVAAFQAVLQCLIEILWLDLCVAQIEFVYPAIRRLLLSSFEHQEHEILCHRHACMIPRVRQVMPPKPL